MRFEYHKKRNNNNLVKYLVVVNEAASEDLNSADLEVEIAPVVALLPLMTCAGKLPTIS